MAGLLADLSPEIEAKILARMKAQMKAKAAKPAEDVRPLPVIPLPLRAALRTGTSGQALAAGLGWHDPIGSLRAWTAAVAEVLPDYLRARRKARALSVTPEA